VLREELATALTAVHRERKTTFLLIEHDLDFVGRLSERVIVMDAGRIIADGTATDVWSNQLVIDAYMGRKL
jgi:branched-chain amino acid transport system ATP-binding protein